MNELNKIGGRLLVVFDGHCGLCNGWVRWALRRDRRDRLRFAPSRSSAVVDLLARYSQPEGPGGVRSTILVFRNVGGPAEEMLVRFGAVRAVLRELPGPWKTAGVALGWIPHFLADPLYGLIARWRYRIWGRLESCPVPTADERERFLESGFSSGDPC